MSKLSHILICSSSIYLGFNKLYPINYSFFKKMLLRVYSAGVVYIIKPIYMHILE